MNQQHPDDISYLLALLRKNKESRSHVKGKDIVLFIGGTGVGKTTTILFLQGHDMVRKTISEKTRLVALTKQVIDCTDAPDDMKIGHECASETSLLRALPPSSNFPAGLILCDAPGQFDTKGCIADLANAIAIANAAQSANSVRPVLLVDFGAAGVLRGQTYSQFCELMGRFFDMKLHTDKVSVFYTKGIRNDMSIETLKQQLLSLYKAYEDDPVVSSFLEFHFRRIEAAGDLLIVDPLDPPTRAAILDIINAIPPIPGGEGSFGLPLSAEALLFLRTQCEEIHREASFYLKKRNFSSLSKCLYSLHLLATETHLKEVNDLYSSLITLITDAINGWLKTVRSNFLSVGHLPTVRESLNYLCQVQQLVPYIDAALVAERDILLHEMNSKLSEIMGRASTSDQFASISSTLEWLQEVQKYLSAFLVPSNASPYDHVQTKVIARVSHIQKHIQQLLLKLKQGTFSHNQTQVETAGATCESIPLTTELPQQLSLAQEVSTIEGHLPKDLHNLCKEAMAGLDSIIASSSDRYQKLLRRKKLVGVEKSLRKEFAILNEVHKSHRLSSFLSSAGRQSTKGASEILQSETQKVMQQIQNHTVNLNFNGVVPLFAHLQLLLRVDEVFGLEFRSGPLKRMFDTMEDQLNSIIKEMDEHLQRALESNDEQQKSILRFVATKMSYLQAAQVLDALLEKQLCQMALFDVIQRIDKRVQLIAEQPLCANEVDWPFVVQGTLIALEHFAPVKAFIPTLPERYNELVELQCRHLSTNLERLKVLQKQPPKMRDLVAMAEMLRLLRQNGSNLQLILNSELLGNTEAKNALQRSHSDAEALFKKLVDWATIRQEKLMTNSVSHISIIQGYPQQSLDIDITINVAHLRDVVDGLVSLKNLDEFLAKSSSTLITQIVEAIQNRVEYVRGQTSEAITHRHLDIAERNLRFLNAASNHFGGYVTVEGLAELSSNLKAKRLELSDTIPNLLERRQFSQIAKILQSFGPTQSALDESEVGKIKLVIADHFDSLCNEVIGSRLSIAPDHSATLKGLEQMQNLLDLLCSAKMLEEYEIPVGEFLRRLGEAWNKLLEGQKKKFLWALSKQRYTEALEVCMNVSRLDHAASFYKELQECWSSCLASLPKHFEQAITKADTNRIDAILRGLEALDDRFEFQSEVITCTLESVRQLWRESLEKKLLDTSCFITAHKIAQAQEELHLLFRLSSAQSMPQDLRREIDKRSSLIEVLQLKMRAVGIDQPTKLRELLEELAMTTYGEFIDKVKEVEEMFKKKSVEFEALMSSHALFLSSSPLGWDKPYKILSMLINLIECLKGTPQLDFHLKRMQEELDYSRQMLREQIDKKVQDLLSARKKRNWPLVQQHLHQMGAAAMGLKELFPDLIRQKCTEIEHALHRVLEKLATARATFNSIDFTSPFDTTALKELSSQLVDLRCNAALVEDSENEGSLTYEEAVGLLADKLGTINSTMGDDVAQRVNVVKNLNSFISCVGEGHGQLKVAAESEKRIVADKFKQELMNTAKRAISCMRKMDDGLEKAMLDLKHLESMVAGVTELLPQSYYQQVLQQLQEQVIAQSKELKNRISTAKETLDPALLAPDILAIHSITVKVSAVDLGALVQKEINSILNLLSQRKGFNFFHLGTCLIEDSTHGRELVEGENYPQFKAFITSLMNELTSRMTWEDAIKEMQNNGSINPAESEQLLLLSKDFQANFDQCLKKYLLGTHPLEDLIHQLKRKFHKGGNPFAKIKNLRTEIPAILAGIFAVWSVRASSSHFKETRNPNCVLKPHPVQILSLFRLLELDTPKEGWFGTIKGKAVSLLSAPKLANHMVQIGTGEGKSIILGGLAVFFALAGCDVYCACYSKYLSERDYKSFSELFVAFNVTQRITYSTLADLAGKLINEDLDIRETTQNWLLQKDKKKWNPPVSVKPGSTGTAKILLIDEVL